MLCPVVVRAVRRVGSLLAGFVLAILCSALSLPALAAPDAKSVAKAHYEAATRLYDVHEYGEALKEYKVGYLARPDPSFLFNIGQCYKRLGQSEQAREFFREYLRKSAPDDPNRALAEARIRELDTREAVGTVPPPVSGAASPPTLTTPKAGSGDSPATGAAFEKAPALPWSAAGANTAGVNPAGLDLSASNTSQPDRSAPAFYRTWWFWSGVGAVVVAGTVTAVLLSRNGGGSPSVSGTTLGTRTVLQ